MSSLKCSKCVHLLLIPALASSWACFPVIAADRSTGVSIRAMGGQPPWLKLESAERHAKYSGAAEDVRLLETNQATSLALAVDDFDGDGAADLAVGYAAAGRGLVTLERGNVEAVAPSNKAVYRDAMEGRTPPSLLSSARVFSTPEPPDFVMSGDFDGDGNRDLLTAARGGGLYLLAGDGTGGFAAARLIPLPGSITTVAAGTFQPGRAPKTVVVGVSGPGGASLLAFETVSGGLNGRPAAFEMPGAVTSLVIDRLDDDGYFDAAVAAGGRLYIFHGGARAPSLETVPLDFAVSDVATGNFLPDRDAKSEIAVLGVDGAIQVLQRGELDTRPITAAEGLARRRTRRSVAAWRPGGPNPWRLGSRVEDGAAGGRLLAARVSLWSGTDLLVIDRKAGEMRLHALGERPVSGKSARPAAGRAAPLALTAGEGTPVAFATLPSKVNGDREMVVLTSGSVKAQIIQQHSASYNVTAGDAASLVSAISAASDGPWPATVNIPPGTYTVADVEIGSTGADITLMGTGVTPTETILQTAASNTTSRIINPGYFDNLALHLQNLTFRHGHTPDEYGGGAIVTGFQAGQTLEVVNCVFDGNQTNSGQWDSGGAIYHNGYGDITITGSTFTNNSTGGYDNHGGAVAVALWQLTPMTATITNSTFTNNTLTAGGSIGGGALSLVGFGESYDEGTGTWSTNYLTQIMNVNHCTFSGNYASNTGGALHISRSAGTLQYNRFSGNSVGTAGQPAGLADDNRFVTTHAEKNWWGKNTGPTSDDAANICTPGTWALAGGGTVPIPCNGGLISSPHLSLRANANPASVSLGGTSTITADLMAVSDGTTLAAGTLNGLPAIPVTFSNPVKGALSGAATSLTNGAGTATFTSSAYGTGSADATVDSQTITANIGVFGPPDLTIAKSHTGNFTQSQTGATYTITVTNSGLGPSSGAVTVADTLPAGLTATAIAGTGWTCTLGTLTCARSDALSASASYPAITVTVDVASDAAASVTNTATVSGGGDSDTTNNTANDPTTITPVADLTITKSHTGNFTQGQTGASYTITVSNAGHAATSGMVTVTDVLPAGLTATAMAGTGWTCTAPTCTRTDALAAGASYPPISLTVDVASNAAAVLTNTVTVAGGGEIVTGNNTASDPTTVTQVADLQVAKAHTGNFRQGQTGAQYTITVSNTGPGQTTGVVTVTDTLPAGLTATGMGGSGWTCNLGTFTCTRSDVLAAGSPYPAITLTVNVAAGAATSVTNNAAVSGGGEINTANNSALDVTTVDQAADLQVSKSHTGNFTQGQAGATYTIVVSNTGPGPTAGLVTVTDTLPAGLVATGMSGSGWTCTAPTCTRSDILAPGSSYPAITLTVNVAGNASANLTNSATVSGGGELDTSNDSASDPTTIVQLPDLTIAKSHAGLFTRGQSGSYTITVSNTGSAATSGIVTVTDTLPASLAATAISGSGWSCALTPLSCTRSDALPTGSSYPPITLTVSVATDAPTPVANSATVSGAPDANPGNNTATDVTAVLVIPEITWTTPAAITYGMALSATQLNASSTAPGTFTYSPGAGTILAAGPHTLSVTFTPTDTNVYAPATASVNLTVNKATPTITWTNPAPIAYGAALSAIQLNATPGAPGSFVYSPDAGTVLATGSHTLTATFTPTDTANYNGATASVTQVVNKATPTISWATPATITYGTALSATQLNATTDAPGSFVYSPSAGTVLSIGSHTLNVTFTPTDTANYNGATASVTLVVNKATPAITWATPAAITYGTALSAAQLNATTGVPGSFAYSPAAGTVLPAGSHTLNVTFTPTDTSSYANANASVILVVNKATPTVTWAAPAAITYGTALSATQLHADAGMPGSYVYSPSAGTVLPAGNNILSVTFTPTDADNYSSAGASVTVLVDKATPSVTWSTPAAITYGTVLGPTQLNATASVHGTFIYSPAGGTTLPAGSNTLSATFTPADSANYNSATASVTQIVNKATPAITWPTPAPIAPGTPLGPAQFNATANAAGTFVYSPAAGTELATGIHTLSVTFTPSDTANYTNTVASVTLAVSERGQSIWFPPIADRWYRDTPVPLGATASSGLPVSYTVAAGPATVSGSMLTITGPGRITVRASQGGGGTWEPAPDVAQSFVAGYRTEILAGQGLAVWIDDRSVLGGSAFIWEPGTTHRIAVLPFQSQMPGSGYRFASWSDGGAREHTITAAAADASYTASFVLQFELRVNVKPDPEAGTVVPGTGFYDAGTTVALAARPNAGYEFVGYSGIEGSSAVMTGPRSVIATFAAAAGPKLEAVADSASFRPGMLTSGALFTVFGSGLGAGTLAITDSAGVERVASVLYSSAAQVNFIAPEGMAPGAAVLRYTGAEGVTATLALEVAAVAPGLFSANMNGRGAPAGQVLRVNAAGQTVFSSALARCGAATGSCESEPIDLGAPTDQLFVVLYGTGFRNYKTMAAVIGGVEAEIAWAGPQPTLPALDQINLKLPRSLAGRGELELTVTVDGRATNTLVLQIR